MIRLFTNKDNNLIFCHFFNEVKFIHIFFSYDHSCFAKREVKKKLIRALQILIFFNLSIGDTQKYMIVNYNM